MKRVVILHRFRLAAIAFLTSIILIGAIFSLVLYSYWGWELRSVQKTILRSSDDAVDALKAKPKMPDFDEAQDEYPGVSISAFNLQGKLIETVGILHMKSLANSDGISRMNGQKVMFHIVPVKKLGTIELGISWTKHEDRIHVLGMVFLLLTLPLAFLSGVITYLASRWTFQPLDQLAIQAESLSHKNLAGRLKYDRQDEFKEFADSLNRMLDRIEQIVLGQERFVQDASHELRTPLTIIRGQIETTLLRSRKNEEYRDTLHSVLEEAERLSRLAEVLLISASNESEAAEVIDLGPVVENQTNRWKDRFREHKVQLKVEIQPAASLILPEEFGAIIDNFLSNALKYSPSGTEVQLTLKTWQQESILDCIDEGPGVPDELKDDVFNRFVRGEKSRNRDLGGFGIGLAVCRKIARMRQGEVTLEPVEKGAHFRLTLPAQPSPARITPEAEAIIA